MRNPNHIVDEWVEKHVAGADWDTVACLAVEYRECVDAQCYYDFDGSRVLWLGPSTIGVRGADDQVYYLTARQFIDSE